MKRRASGVGGPPLIFAQAVSIKQVGREPTKPFPHTERWLPAVNKIPPEQVLRNMLPERTVCFKLCLAEKLLGRTLVGECWIFRLVLL